MLPLAKEDLILKVESKYFFFFFLTHKLLPTLFLEIFLCISVYLMPLFFIIENEKRPCLLKGHFLSKSLFFSLILRTLFAPFFLFCA